MDTFAAIQKQNFTARKITILQKYCETNASSSMHGICNLNYQYTVTTPIIMINTKIMHRIQIVFNLHHEEVQKDELKGWTIFGIVTLSTSYSALHSI